MAKLQDPNNFIRFPNNVFIVITFTSLAVFYFLAGIFYGLDFTDTFYHLNLARTPPEEIKLYPILLSSLFIEALTELFGKELLYLRLINALIYIMAILIPFIFIKTRTSIVTTIFYIGCVLFLIAPLNANVLGYDSFTILIFSLIFTVSIIYFHRKETFLLVILSLLCSISILIRLPNAVVLPILMLGIVYQQKILSPKFHFRMIKLPLVFLILTLTGVLIVYYFYYKDWDVFKTSSIGTISHNIELLFYKYLRDGIKLLSFSLFITGTYSIFTKIFSRYGRYLAYGLVIILYAAFIKLFLLRYSYPIFLSALVLSIAVIHLYSLRGKHKIFDIFILGMFFCFLFINAIGSNLGLLKSSFLFLLLPFVLCVISIQQISYWKFILVLLIPLSIFLKFYRTYEGQNIFTLNKTVNIELLYPIKTNEERSDFLIEIDRKVKQLQFENFSVFFYGNKSHIFHYLYPTSLLGIKAIDQPLENTIFLPEIEKEIKDKRKVAIFLIPSYPDAPENMGKVVECELMKVGFKKVQEGTLNMLIKEEN